MSRILMISSYVARDPVGLTATMPPLQRAGIEVVPVDVAQAREARRAFGRFGKGRDVAGLNHGDCFAYALAVVLAEPLLFKGDDFVHTDVAFAVPPPSRE
jgi:ribonuclease VapC